MYADLRIQTRECHAVTAPIIRNCTETIPTIAQRCQWQALQPILPAMSADGITAHQNYQFGAGLEDPPTGQGWHRDCGSNLTVFPARSRRA
jgi:hypothetical protein